MCGLSVHELSSRPTIRGLVHCVSHVFLMACGHISVHSFKRELAVWKMFVELL